jgi:hypothetical protein
MNVYFEDWTPIIREPCSPPETVDLPIKTVWIPDTLIERYAAAKNVFLDVAHEVEQYDPQQRRV